MNQTQSNKNNALLSTGPRTAEGKRRSSRNAIKTGVYSVSPVLEGLEASAEWESFRNSLLSCLCPEGEMERVLAERVMLNAWRLRRLVRFETMSIARDLSECRKAVDSLEKCNSWLGDVLGCLKRFEAAAETAEFEIDEVELVLWQAFASSSEESGRFELAIEFEPYWEGFGSKAVWTKFAIRQALLERARLINYELSRFIEKLKADAREAHKSYLGELRKAKTEAHRKACQSLLLPEDQLARLHRAESHLGRQLRGDLHELQRLQASRRGVTGVTPVALDVNLEAAQRELKDASWEV